MRPVSGFERPRFQWLFVGLGGVLMVVAAAEGVALRRAHTQYAALHAADLNTQVELDRVRAQLVHEQASREALRLELARHRSGTDGTNQRTLTLSPLTKRGALPPEPTVTRPPDQDSIQLRLIVPGRTEPADARYSIVLRTWSGGETVWSRSGLRSTMADNKRMVTALVTGDIFSPGAYEISLRRAGDGGEVGGYEVSVR